MNVHRDASDRLTASLDAERSAHEGMVARVVKRFGLRPAGELVDGFDAVFQDFTCGTSIVSLEWDNWMGLSAVAKSSDAETLVREIAGFFAG